MFEDIPLIYGSLRILRGLSLIYDHNWRRYFCLSVTTFLFITQCIYVVRTKEGVEALIRNAYVFVLWLNTLIRAYLMLYDGKEYKRLIANLVRYYYELKATKDSYILGLIDDANQIGKAMSRGNLFLGSLTCIGFGSFPFLLKGRVLPFGSIIPGIDEYQSPYYECIYIYQMVITPCGCCMYIPYTSFIVALIMFGIVMCKSLQHRLRMLKHENLTAAQLDEEIINCIMYQRRIIRYISTINELTVFIFSVEFLAFGALICALLFLLIIVDSAAQTIIVCAYITMILAQILALYWYANELREQNSAIADAVYETEWFTFPNYVQKKIILIIVRAQKPCSLMIANTYPMTLQLFQSLLNTSYSFFTLIKRVYK